MCNIIMNVTSKEKPPTPQQHYFLVLWLLFFAATEKVVSFLERERKWERMLSTEKNLLLKADISITFEARWSQGKKEKRYPFSPFQELFLLQLYFIATFLSGNLSVLIWYEPSWLNTSSLYYMNVPRDIFNTKFKKNSYNTKRMWQILT